MSIREYYKWLKRDWAKAGLIVSLCLFLILFFIVRKTDVVIFILLLQTPLYMLHLTEEYVFPGGFGKFFNMGVFAHPLKKVQFRKGAAVIIEQFCFRYQLLSQP